MTKDIIFPHEVKDHPDRDDTWELDEMDIEEKIKELRKEIYKLQNCRKKQPELIVYRKEGYGSGPMRAHIFQGWQVRDIDKNLFCADHWRNVNAYEAEIINKKYDLTPEAITVLEETIGKKIGEK